MPIPDIAANIVDRFANGEWGTTEAAMLHKIAKAWTDAKSSPDVKDAILHELESRGTDNRIEEFGVKIGQREAARYDYSGCGHPVLDRIKALKNNLAAEEKRIQKMLLAGADTFTIDSRLEVKNVPLEKPYTVTCQPPVRSGGTSVTFS